MMRKLAKRISNRIKITAKAFCSDAHFSLYYAFLRIAAELGGRIGLRWLADKARRRKDRWIVEYLRKELDDVVSRFSADEGWGTPVPNAPIWVCWWTGEETAPLLVKKCIQSIRANAEEHPVHLITRENYAQFLEIPDYMLKKVAVKQMGLAHLADYIRVKLLANYGGLWLDATIFCSAAVPESYFCIPFFSSKGPVRPSEYVSDYRWTTFCLGGWKSNVCFRYLAEAFETYWKRNTYAVDYLFFDYIIILGYESISAVKTLIDELPDNNIHRDDLQAAMNATMPASQWNSVIHPDTVLYKLSWREQYSICAENGTESIYYYFINM